MTLAHISCRDQQMTGHLWHGHQNKGGLSLVLFSVLSASLHRHRHVFRIKRVRHKRRGGKGSGQKDRQTRKGKARQDKCRPLARAFVLLVVLLRESTQKKNMHRGHSFLFCFSFFLLVRQTLTFPLLLFALPATSPCVSSHTTSPYNLLGHLVGNVRVVPTNHLCVKVPHHLSCDSSTLDNTSFSILSPICFQRI